MLVKYEYMLVKYEYAGFRYIIERVDTAYSIKAFPNQHSAATKEKHLKAALECYLQDRMRKQKTYGKKEK